jgi:four helix bundle protein
MGTIRNFEELAIWKMSRIMVNEVYQDIRSCRDFGFRDQITRAGISIMNNISEGFGRASNAEFRQYLKISKGSASEVKSMYYIAEDLGFISHETATNRREEVQRLINNNSTFIKYLKTHQPV